MRRGETKNNDGDHVIIRGWVWVWLTETLTQPDFEHFTPSILGKDRDFEDGSNAQTQPL